MATGSSNRHPDAILPRRVSFSATNQGVVDEILGQYYPKEIEAYLKFEKVIQASVREKIKIARSQSQFQITIRYADLQKELNLTLELQNIINILRVEFHRLPESVITYIYDDYLVINWHSGVIKGQIRAEKFWFVRYWGYLNVFLFLGLLFQKAYQSQIDVYEAYVILGASFSIIFYILLITLLDITSPCPYISRKAQKILDN